MSTNRNREMLRELFHAALQHPPSTIPPPASSVSEPHPMGDDDDDLLLDWSLGNLSPERHRQFLEHLGNCPAFRQEFANMVRLGILELPDVPAAVDDENPANSPEPSQPTTFGAGQMRPDGSSLSKSRPENAFDSNLPRTGRPWRKRSMVVLAVGLAASLLVMALYRASDFGSRDGNRLIAAAERDLQSGRAEQALQRIEDLLGRAKGLSAEQQGLATGLLEASGYALARDSLVKGDFRDVMEMDGRVARHGSGSGRLANLRIQAERGETAERSLSQRTSLREHYEYELDGRQVTKSLAIRPVTETDRRIEAEMQSALATYPDEPDLRLNYGQFLLELRRFAEAEDVLEIVLEIDPNNALAHLGLGIAILQQADDHSSVARALPHFQAAARLAPDDPVMKENLAICQNRLATIGAP